MKTTTLLALAVATVSLAMMLTGQEVRDEQTEKFVAEVGQELAQKITDSVNTINEVFAKVNKRDVMLRRRGWGSYYGGIALRETALQMGKRDDEPAQTRHAVDVAKRGWGSFLAGAATVLLLGKRHPEVPYVNLQRRFNDNPLVHATEKRADVSDAEFKAEVAKAKDALDVLNGVVAVAQLQA